MNYSRLHLVQQFELSSEPSPDKSVSYEDWLRLKHFLGLWLLLVTDTVGTKYPRDVSDTAVKSFLRRWYASDVLEFQNTLEAMLMILREVNPLEQRSSLIKAKLRANGLSLGRWEFVLIRSRISDFLHGDVDSFAEINTLLQFMKRCTLRDREELVDDCVAKYWQVEKDLPTQYPSWLITELRRELSVFVLDPDDFLPEHGNGATSQTERGAGLGVKDLLFANDARTEFLLRRLGVSHRVGDRVTEYEETHIHFDTVPKGLSKRRGITFESIAKQYVQHGVFAMFDAWLRRHPEWGIDLHDQSKNCDLCWMGNYTGQWATLDLSDASDSVTWQLVKLVFPRSTLQYLLCCHTDKVAFNIGNGYWCHDIRKYGGMGNGVTFATMSVLLAATIRVAQRLIRKPWLLFRVYGDDMICHAAVFDLVVQFLGLLGFKVNTEKSYAPYSYFHESCGLEVYLGQDVTPLRISRKYDPLSLADRGSTQVGSFVDLANEAYDRGYKTLRKYLINHIMEFYPLWPFGKTEGCLHTDSNRINAHLPYEWVADHQRYRFLCDCVVTTFDNLAFSSDIEYWRYQETLEAMARSRRSEHGKSPRFPSDPEDRIDVAMGRRSSKVSRRWRVVEHYALA